VAGNVHPISRISTIAWTGYLRHDWLYTTKFVEIWWRVVIHVLSGSGHFATELGGLDLEPGILMRLPRRSRRQFGAGPGRSCYLTVHRRRQALVLQTLETAPRPDVGRSS
jgi:hypothetical protein